MSENEKTPPTMIDGPGYVAAGLDPERIKDAYDEVPAEESDECRRSRVTKALLVQFARGGVKCFADDNADGSVEIYDSKAAPQVRVSADGRTVRGVNGKVWESETMIVGLRLRGAGAPRPRPGFRTPKAPSKNTSCPCGSGKRFAACCKGKKP